MTRHAQTLGADYFDGMYAADPDPWRFRTSAYETRKYAATLAALTRPRYANALEVGCSIGVFTAQLATRCDHVLAIDASAVAIESARVACAALTAVQFETCMVPQSYPAGRFDLIVLSEILYFLTEGDLARVAAQSCAAQPDGGEILLCHWLGATNYPLSGEEATRLFVEVAIAQGYAHAVVETGTYRLDRLLRA